jgi:hypothetical protein
MNETKQPVAAKEWAPYEPDERAPWNLQRVVHLHARAGFAATWDEIQRDLKDGPAASIDRLLSGQSRNRALSEKFERETAALAAAAFGSGDTTPAGGYAIRAGGPGTLKAWWIYRMLFTPDPLGERLTLLWHNHFATSFEKVFDVTGMRRQNELFRKHARAPFGELLNAVMRDRALLVYLDAPANRKGHPNENLARELMELFTLGIGHYTEDDVKEAARALTGWTVTSSGFREIPDEHDAGEKTILGQKGPWKGADLLRILLSHPATAERLADRICDLLMGENATAAGVKTLAEGMRRNHLDVGWAAATVLRSRAFFAEGNLRKQVRGPVEYVVGAVRALEMLDNPPSTAVLADWCYRLGQDLFFPPNVGGWPGGRAWLGTATVIARANYAAALASGELCAGAAQRPFDTLALARKHNQGHDLDDVVTFYAGLLLGIHPDRAWRERFVRALGHAPAMDAEIGRRILVLLLASPEAQMA